MEGEASFEGEEGKEIGERARERAREGLVIYGSEVFVGEWKGGAGVRMKGWSREENDESELPQQHTSWLTQINKSLR